MKRTMQLTIGLLLLAVCPSRAGDKPSHLFPNLHPGQKVIYLIEYRSEKKVKTESRVVAPMAPNASQLDAHGLLEIEVLGLQPAGTKMSVQARVRFLTLNSGVWVKKDGDKKPNWDAQRIDPDAKTLEFTISPDGSVEKVTGLDSLFPEQQQAWQEWVARFALAWTLPHDGLRIGEKWKSEQPETANSPIAALYWARESVYVRKEPCHASELSFEGTVSSAGGPPDTCAVLLTTATLKQKSSPKDATPEDFKLHELKTMGRAKGTNEIITYISLATGLVVRATEEAAQQMDVVVAKADGSNRVHYNVNATSRSEVRLVTETLLTQP
jgi:hypothetical protein